MVQIKMNNIDYIMDLLDWNNSTEVQAKGIELAKKVKNINVFLQPCNRKHNKNVWENCAKVLSTKTDEELTPYLIELFEWLQDLNWPGAFCIMERLKKYGDNSSFSFSFDICIKCAKALKDDAWESNLYLIRRE